MRDIIKSKRKVTLNLIDSESRKLSIYRKLGFASCLGANSE